MSENPAVTRPRLVAVNRRQLVMRTVDVGGDGSGANIGELCKCGFGSWQKAISVANLFPRSTPCVRSVESPQGAETQRRWRLPQFKRRSTFAKMGELVLPGLRADALVPIGIDHRHHHHMSLIGPATPHLAP